MCAYTPASRWVYCLVSQGKGSHLAATDPIVDDCRGILVTGTLLGELIHQLGRLVACRGRDYLRKTFFLIYNKLFAG